MSEARQVHFVVQGDFITETSRRLWNDEGEPEKALDILLSLDGITYDQCLDVLEGRSKLIGDSSNGIDIVDDDAKGKSLKEILKTLKKERDIAIDERLDAFQLLADDSAIGASPTGRRKVPRRKTRKNVGSVIGTVFKEGYEFDDIDSGEDVQKLSIWQQVDDIDISSARRSRAELPEPEPQPPPIPDDKITSNTGWLTPEGKFYACRYGQHREIADLVGFDTDDKRYVRCAWHMDQQWFFCESDALTQTQRELIKNFCSEKNVEEPYWMQDA